MSYSEICVVTKVKAVYEKIEGTERYREIEILWRGKMRWGGGDIQARLIRTSAGLETRWRSACADWNRAASLTWKIPGPELAKAIKIIALSKKMRI